MAGLNCEIRWETRLCEVDGELGYFHCWEHWSNVIDASPPRDGYLCGCINPDCPISLERSRKSRAESIQKWNAKMKGESHE